jgi:hypothetical protein
MADERGRFCRRVRPEDATRVPAELGACLPDVCPAERVLRDRVGARYRLTQVRGVCREIPELRWVRDPAAHLLRGLARNHPDGAPAASPGVRPRVPVSKPQVVSLRSVVGALECYEPARTMTATAIGAHRFDSSVSVVSLGAELRRLATSSITLNRLLRDAVLRAVAEGMTLSMIAMRCGRIKRDPRGNVSGETSWLGRRLGLLPEGGNSRPTPWIHSDVLALIARRGLGVSPREVELG